MADELLVGDITSGGTQTSAANQLWMIRFQAIVNGTATKMKVFTPNPGTGKTIKLAVYANSGSNPSTKLAQIVDVPSGFGVVADLPTPLSIDSGEYYWLGVAREAGDISATTTGGTSRYADITYSTFEFPDPMTGLSFVNRTWKFQISLWGTLAAGGAGRLIGSGDPSMIHVGHPKMIHVANPSLIRARGG